MTSRNSLVLLYSTKRRELISCSLTVDEALYYHIFAFLYFKNYQRYSTSKRPGFFGVLWSTFCFQRLVADVFNWYVRTRRYIWRRKKKIPRTAILMPEFACWVFATHYETWSHTGATVLFFSSSLLFPTSTQFLEQFSSRNHPLKGCVA